MSAGSPYMLLVYVRRVLSGTEAAHTQMPARQLTQKCLWFVLFETLNVCADIVAPPPCVVNSATATQIAYTLPWIIMLSQLAYYSKVYGPQVRL